MARPDALAVALSGAAQLVVDASIAADLAVGDATRGPRARRFFAICTAGNVVLQAPPVFMQELDSAVRLAIHAGKLPAADAPGAYAVLDTLVVQLTLDDAKLAAVRLRARQIAEELQQPRVYDATYAALAESLGCDFWTADRKFANAAQHPAPGQKGHKGPRRPRLPFVKFIGNY